MNTEEKARALVKQFLDSALTSRELLVSLIERVELTEEKEFIGYGNSLKNCRNLLGQSFTIGVSRCIIGCYINDTGCLP